MAEFVGDWVGVSSTFFFLNAALRSIAFTPRYLWSKVKSLLCEVAVCSKITYFLLNPITAT